MVTSNTFETLVLIATLLSSILLAFESPPPDPDTPMAILLDDLNVAFSLLFVLEMGLKMVGFGLCGKRGYFADGWNWLDFVIVLASCLSLLFPDAQIVRSVRVVRVLRPLRMVKRLPALRRIVNALLRALPACGQFCYVYFLIQLVFAIIGVHLFRGATASCNDSRVLTAAECVGSFTDETSGAWLHRTWANPPYIDFDWIGGAMLTTFEIATLEAWKEPLFRTMDVVSHGVAPKENASPWLSLYVISWVVVAAVFLLNLFLGILLTQFNSEKSRDDGSIFLSAEQQRYLISLKILGRREVSGAPLPSEAWSAERRAFFKLVNSSTFATAVNTVIGLSTLLLCSTWYGQPAWMGTVQDVGEYLVTAIFCAEVVLKIWGLGWKQYITNGWNAFDFFVTVTSLLGDALDLAYASGLLASGSGSMQRALKFMRVLRMLRVLRMHQGFASLLSSLVFALPAILNVGMLFLVNLYIFAILGVGMFNELALTGDFINEEANFASLGVALLTLFRCSTGGDWNGIMHDAMITEATHPGRCSEAKGTCGHPLLASLFFISYMITSTYFVMSLLIAAVIDAFAEDESLPISAHHRNVFDEVWANYDPLGRGYVMASSVRGIFLELPAALGGFGDTDASAVPQRLLTQSIAALDVPTRDGRVFFYDFLDRLTVKLGQFEVPTDPQSASTINEYKTRIGDVSGALRDEGGVAQVLAAVAIQRVARKVLEARTSRERQRLAEQKASWTQLPQRAVLTACTGVQSAYAEVQKGALGSWRQVKRAVSFERKESEKADERVKANKGETHDSQLRPPTDSEPSHSGEQSASAQDARCECAASNDGATPADPGCSNEINLLVGTDSSRNLEPALWNAIGSSPPDENVDYIPVDFRTSILSIRRAASTGVGSDKCYCGLSGVEDTSSKATFRHHGQEDEGVPIQAIRRAFAGQQRMTDEEGVEEAIEKSQLPAMPLPQDVALEDLLALPPSGELHSWREVEEDAQAAEDAVARQLKHTKQLASDVAAALALTRTLNAPNASAIAAARAGTPNGAQNKESDHASTPYVMV